MLKKSRLNTGIEGPSNVIIGWIPRGTSGPIHISKYRPAGTSPKTCRTKERQIIAYNIAPNKLQCGNFSKVSFAYNTADAREWFYGSNTSGPDASYSFQTIWPNVKVL